MTSTKLFLQEDPSQWVHFPVSELFGLDPADLADVQLHWMQKRFTDLLPRLPVLQQHAAQQNVNEIRNLNAGAAALFTHTMYKSYPTALIEKKDFAGLTRWLQRLTTNDLSKVDMKGVDDIDGWLERLDQAGMFVFHSTGTSGNLSFFPRSKVEEPAWAEGTYKMLEAFTGQDMHGVHLPVFWPAYRGGRQAGMRLIEYFGPRLAGSEQEYHSLFDEKMSADFMAIAMRLKRARDRNDLKTMDLLKAAFMTKGAVLTLPAKRGKLTKEFFDMMMRDYKGRRVFLMAQATDLLDIARVGLQNGVRGLFAPDSVFLTGGGFKGQQVEANWREMLKEFYGINEVNMSYGMTELNVYNIGCKNGHYHVFPWNIPFVIDPVGGMPLPRQGVQTGRAGYFDTLAQTYWGGILTGDRVTIHFDEDCGCGWKGPFIDDNVRRFSELTGGEDIVSCAAVQTAYTDAAELYAELAVEQ